MNETIEQQALNAIDRGEAVMFYRRIGEVACPGAQRCIEQRATLRVEFLDGKSEIVFLEPTLEASE